MAGWRREHVDEHRARNRRNRAAARERNQQRLIQYLSTHPCVDCGETDVTVLDFDHIAGEKERSVVEMALRGCSWARVLEEIKKCQVRCANDHRRKEAMARGFYRAVLAGDAEGSRRRANIGGQLQ